MSKINKLGKSTFVIAILSFLLVAVLAFGGTYAYFSAQNAGVTGGFSTGHLAIGANDVSSFFASDVSGIIVAPGQTIASQSVSAEVDSNIKYYIRAKVTINIAKDDVYGAGEHKCGVTEPDVGAIVVTADWTQEGSTGYYYPTYAVNDPAATGYNATKAITFTATVAPWVGAKGCTEYMDAEVTVTVQLEVMQAEHLTASGKTISDNSSLHAAWDVVTGYNTKA